MNLRHHCSAISLWALLVLSATSALAASRDTLVSGIDARFDEHHDIALRIWDLAELGYLEFESSKLLQEKLTAAGFAVVSGVAGMPTAFVAEAGTGGPVIALLAEFDALPGITQTASPTREEIPGKAGGQACGHHLFGTASLGAAVAIREWLAQSDLPGTIRVYGTPAEEGGSGKAYLVRAGLFDDVDAVLSWHPGDVNRAEAAPSLANRSARFNFRGVSAHAAVSPEKARSALDGVEAFNFMINLMREHVPQETRIHCVITEGGQAPNVVPDHAQVYYYVRHPDAQVLLDIWQRVEEAARGAAAGGTTIGIKGLQLAANALALTAADFYENPVLLQQARASLEAQRGEDFVYMPLIGDREPPLDYRRKP